MRETWTQAEEQILRVHAADDVNVLVALLPGRSNDSIHNRRRRLFGKKPDRLALATTGSLPCDVQVSRSGIRYREHSCPVHGTYSGTGSRMVVSLPFLTCQQEWRLRGAVP